MIDLSKKVACVIDFGLAISVAQRLSMPDGFGEVLYWNPSSSDYPIWNDLIVGKGVPGLHCIESLWDHIGRVDIFVFTELYQGPFQRWLREDYIPKNGREKPLVFGAGMAEELEYKREKLKEAIMDAGLPVGSYEVVKGMSSLKSVLMEKEDCYIKVDTIRGNMETFHWERWELTSPYLRYLDHKLGAFREDAIFIIEDKIDAIAEIAVDGFMIGGEWSTKMLFGIEIKDTGYLGKMVSTATLPKKMLDIQRKMADLYRSYGYAGFHGNEVRIGEDKKYYLIDETNRFPAPPGELITEMLDSYPQDIWAVASLEQPEMQCTNQWGVQLIIKSEWAEKDNTQPIYFPQEFEHNVKIYSLTMKGNVYNNIPSPGLDIKEIGSVVATGKSAKEAIKKAKEVAESLQGYKIEVNVDALSECTKAIDRIDKAGIHILSNG